jgi:transcription antitermination factor NusG
MEAPDRGQWRALQCAPRQERHVVAELVGYKFQAYCPTLWMRERQGQRRMREMERPMFPGYAFVRCLPEQISTVKATCSFGSQRRNVQVLGVVIPEHLRRIKIDIERLSEEAIDAVRLAEACHATKKGRKQLRWNFTEGDRVRILEGPFAGFYAAIAGEVDDHGRIRALAEIFARPTTLTLNADDVEKV